MNVPNRHSNATNSVLNEPKYRIITIGFIRGTFFQDQNHVTQNLNS